MSTRMKVAVTGGSGKIGSAVVRRFVEAGHEVTILDKRAPHERIARFVFANLADRQFIQPLFENCDAVIHLGEIPNPEAGDSPHDVFVRNTAAGSTVLQACADLQTPRVIYTSSCQVYGLWGSDERGRHLPLTSVPMDESQPLKPFNPYALAKIANEQYAQLMADRGLSVAIFRLPHMVSLRWNGRWMKWLRRQPNFHMEHFDGFNSFLDVRDAADAYFRAVQTPRPGCEAYHFVSPSMIGDLSLRQRMSDWGISIDLPAEWPDHAPPISCDKAKAHFGWEAKHTYASLMDEYAELDRQA